MREALVADAFADLVPPVRPCTKARYPLTPFVRYASWTTSAGLPFHPWLRVHARLGASIVRIRPGSMTIPATVGG